MRPSPPSNATTKLHGEKVPAPPLPGHTALGKSCELSARVLPCTAGITAATSQSGVRLSPRLEVARLLSHSQQCWCRVHGPSSRKWFPEANQRSPQPFGTSTAICTLHISLLLPSVSYYPSMQHIFAVCPPPRPWRTSTFGKLLRPNPQHVLGGLNHSVLWDRYSSSKKKRPVDTPNLKISSATKPFSISSRLSQSCE